MGKLKLSVGDKKGLVAAIVVFNPLFDGIVVGGKLTLHLNNLVKKHG